MTFTPAGNKVPTSIGAVIVILKEDGAPNANYQVVIKDQNGQRMSIPQDTGDLVPHLTNADKAWLIDFMARMRAKATAEFLA